MEIVTIFGESLYAVKYEGEAENEYDRLMDLWTDVSYLRQFAKDARGQDLESFIRYTRLKDVKSFVDAVSEDAEDIQDFMYAVEGGEDRLDDFFKNYQNNESGFRVLSLQKGKPNKNSFLRLYALRIDAETYLITGGAIKIVATTQESEDLMDEESALGSVRAYLQDNGVFENDSFQEFKIELDEN
jgi:hypothetical protein